MNVPTTNITRRRRKSGNFNKKFGRIFCKTIDLFCNLKSIRCHISNKLSDNRRGTDSKELRSTNLSGNRVVAGSKSLFVSPYASKSNSNIFKGRRFCISGKLRFSQKEMIKKIESNGGILRKSITKDCDYLIVSAPNKLSSSKCKTAIQKGVPIFDEQYIYDSILRGESQKCTPYRLSTSGASRFQTTLIRRPKNRNIGTSWCSVPC